MVGEAKGERSYRKMLRNKNGKSKVLSYNVSRDDDKRFAISLNIAIDSKSFNS